MEVKIKGAIRIEKEFKIAPQIPYNFNPTYVAVLSKTGPGVIWAREITSLNCSAVSQPFEISIFWIIPITDHPPPKARKPTFTKEKNTSNTLISPHVHYNSTSLIFKAKLKINMWYNLYVKIVKNFIFIKGRD